MVFRPRLSVVTQENVTLSPAAGNLVLAFLGTAKWGPINTVQEFSSFSQFFEVFKEDATGLTLTRGVDIAYNNGASDIKVVRIVSGSEAKSTLNLLDGATPAIQVDALYHGTYGDNIGVTVLANGANFDLQVTDGTRLEVFDNNGAGYSTNAAMIADVNATSQLVRLTQLDPGLVDAASQAFLTGGDDGVTGLIDSDYTTALDAQLNSEEFDILLCPGKTVDAFHTTMVGKLNTRASTEDRFAVFISGVAVDETIATIKARTTSGFRGTILAPSMKYTRRDTGLEEVQDGSYLACAYAGGMASRNVSSSPTRKAMSIAGLQVDSATGKDFYNNSEQESLLSARVVPVTKIGGVLAPSRGITRNADQDSLFWEQNIVMVVDFLQKQIFLELSSFIGENNDAERRKAIGRVVDNILEGAQRDDTIEAYQPTEVVEGASPDTILVNMIVAPLVATNFINVTLSLTNA